MQAVNQPPQLQNSALSRDGDSSPLEHSESPQDSKHEPISPDLSSSRDRLNSPMKRTSGGVFKNSSPGSPHRYAHNSEPIDKNRLSRLKNRLSFAKYKLENGWQNQTISQLEGMNLIPSSDRSPVPRPPKTPEPPEPGQGRSQAIDSAIRQLEQGPQHESPNADKNVPTDSVRSPQLRQSSMQPIDSTPSRRRSSSHYKEDPIPARLSNLEEIASRSPTQRRRHENTLNMPSRLIMPMDDANGRRHGGPDPQQGPRSDEEDAAAMMLMLGSPRAASMEPPPLSSSSSRTPHNHRSHYVNSLDGANYAPNQDETEEEMSDHEVG